MDTTNWLQQLFSPPMPPHGHCYLWNNDLVFLHVSSDAITALAYYSIPAALIYLARKRKDLVFNHIFFLFSLFIFACGTTHLLSIWNVWHGAYWLSGGVKAITATASILTAIVVWPLIPKILALPSNTQLRNLNQRLTEEVTENERQRRRLETLSAALERRAEERTEELALSQQRYRTLLESLSSVIWTADPAGKFIEEQPSWSKYTGQLRSEYQGFGWRNALHEDDRDRISEQWHDSVRNKSIHRATGKIWHQPSQSYRSFSAKAVPVLEEDGEISEWVGFMEDISEQQLAEERFSRAVEASPTAMLIIDQKGGIEHANQEALSLFGYPESEIIGLGVEKLVPDRYLDSHRQHRQRYYEEPHKRRMGENRDLYAKRRDGSTFPVEVGLNPIPTADGITVLCSVLDISERKEFENTLARKNKLLESSNKELEQFAYVASHDLKEPVRKIGAFSEILLRKIKGKLPQDELELFHKITDASQRMGRLIDDLLAFSRASADTAAMEQVDLNELMITIGNDLESRIKANKIDFRVGPLPAMKGISSQLYQLMSNLVGNAIKFSAQAEHPKVEVTAAELPDSIEIRVADNGIGIAPEHQQRIFRIFERLHGRGEYEGSGIGLAICKRIAEKHHAEIRIESDLGKGAAFILNFPRED